MTTLPSQIDHLFVLMLENRSFDHLFGGRPNVDGVDETRMNLDLSGRPCFQTALRGPRSRVFAYDPPHDSLSMAAQLAGPQGPMSGFVQSFERAFPDVQRELLQPEQVMQYLPPGTLPMTDYLADHFAISDRWFSPIPTQTMPNRMYAMCGHSNGERDNPEGGLNYLSGYSNDDSIFHKLKEHGLGWRVYCDNLLPLVALVSSLRGPLLRDEHRRPMQQFERDLREAGPDFPALTWLEPTYVWSEFFVLDPFFPEPNDDHPPSDLQRGQALLRYIYAALRNSPIWERSALVIAYDENGGFYDHVTPPACLQQDDGFAQRGARVPATVISPWVKPGSVVRPSSPDQVFDHCSTLKFLCERHGIEPWTTRLRDPSTASLADFFGASPVEAPRFNSVPAAPPAEVEPLELLTEVLATTQHELTRGMRQLFESLTDDLPQRFERTRKL